MTSKACPALGPEIPPSKKGEDRIYLSIVSNFVKIGKNFMMLHGITHCPELIAGGLSAMIIPINYLRERS
jgi:hypothetical protein